MKEKITCDSSKLSEAIVRYLRQSVSDSEVDNGGTPVSVVELMEILQDEFEFTGEEFCKILNALSLDSKINCTFIVDEADEGIKTEDRLPAFFVDGVSLGPKARGK